MITETEINNAYKELASSKENYERLQATAIDSKTHLDSLFATEVAGGIISGKNDTERKGQFENRYTDLVDALHTRTNLADEAKLELDLAGIEVSRVQALLRLAEVLAQTGKD
jgi:protein tyrosine phosphatase